MTAKPETAAEVLATDIRNLIVMDTQYGWRGSTELKHEDILRLEARGWVAEGDENAEYDVTDEGRAVIERALSAQEEAAGEVYELPTGERRVQLTKEARDLPVGTKLYTHPAPSLVASDEVLIAITRGEGYEDVHPQLVAEDALRQTLHGGCQFAWRVVTHPAPAPNDASGAVKPQCARQLDNCDWPRCGCLGAKHPAPARDAHPDDLAVDRFAAQMKAKLAAARAKGRSGWDGPECNADILSRMLRDHVEKGDPRDVANFCCFLWNRGESIQPAPARVTEDARDALMWLRSALDCKKFVWDEDQWRAADAALTAALEADHGN